MSLFDWFKKTKTEDLPDFWQRYQERLQETSYDHRRLIADTRFVVFDTETTGLDVRKDYLLSIGAVSVQDWQIDLSDSLECFIRQSYQPDAETIIVHGILPGDRISKVEEREAVCRFLDYIGGSILVGHHVAFDVGMINQALRPMVGRKLANRTLDTVALARRLSPPTTFHKAGAFSLDHLCRRFGIPLSDRHTAAGDAFITAILFMKLVSRMQSRGVRTLGDLFR